MLLPRRVNLMAGRLKLAHRACKPVAQTLVLILVGLPLWHMLMGSGDTQRLEPATPSHNSMQTGQPVSQHLQGVNGGKQTQPYRRDPSTSHITLGKIGGGFSFNITSLLEKKEPLRMDDVSIIGTKRNTTGFLTIGIPTIYRKNAGSTYLQSTLQSIVDQTSDKEKDEIVVLIFVADFNETYRKEVIQHTEKHYSSYLASGFFQIMLVEKEAYPPLDNLKRNYNDAAERVKWRSKQVSDFAFMFYYGRNLSVYYLQIEDDVICAPNFVPQMKDFIKKQKDKWITLEFSELGFIGKLYDSSNLAQLARFMLLFYQEQPVDWLFRYFAKLLTFPKMPLRKPTLFQHIGEHSSLPSKKLNKLKDKFFAGGKTIEIPVPQPIPDVKNPPAAVFTTMEHYQNYLPIKAYQTGSYFWGKKPALNDSFYVIFTEPVHLKKLTIETGHPFQRNDYLRSGRVEVSPRVLHLPTQTKGQCNCTDYYEVGTFKDNGHLEVGDLDKQVKFSVKCLRITVTKEQEEWLIIHQIAVEMKK